jgi:hypothetical protein
MTVTTVPTGHFIGGRALTQAPAVGSDVRALETILQSVVTDLNTASVANGVQTGQIAAIVDDHVRATVTGLDMKTGEHEHTAVLTGDAGKKFYATHLLIKSSLNVGALNANGTINIGTAADGAQIAAAVALTGIGAAGTGRMVPLAAHSVLVAGNATLYFNVQTAENGAGTLEIDVVICGRQY